MVGLEHNTRMHSPFYSRVVSSLSEMPKVTKDEAVSPPKQTVKEPFSMDLSLKSLLGKHTSRLLRSFTKQIWLSDRGRVCVPGAVLGSEARP